MSDYLHSPDCAGCDQPWRVSYSIIDQTTGYPAETTSAFCECTDAAHLLLLVRVGRGGRPGWLGSRLEYCA